jgi:hypothetical protein
MTTTAPAVDPVYGIPNLLLNIGNAIRAVSAHFGGRQPVEVYSVQYNWHIGARWIDADGEETVIEFDMHGNPLKVGYSILTEADKAEGITEPEWYDCTELDGLWEEIAAVLLAAGLTPPRKRRSPKGA